MKYLSSFTAYLRGMNKAMTGAAEVPTSRPLVLLLSRYFSALAATPAGGELTGTLMNKDFSRYTIVLHVWDSASHDLAFENSLKTILPRLKALGTGALPDGVTAEYWGEVVTVLQTSAIMLRNQISSIVLSVVLVFLVSALVLRSARHGLVVLAPLAVGIMLNFIVMAVFRIPLDAVTITFASIAIGIGVDNAIHLVIQYRRQREIWPGGPEKVIEHTLKAAGRPMVLTTLSIMAALLVFVFSAFRPIVYFGVLISLSLVMTTAGALIPALAALRRLDAGGAPDRPARRPGGRRPVALLPGDRVVERLVEQEQAQQGDAEGDRAAGHGAARLRDDRPLRLHDQVDERLLQQRGTVRAEGERDHVQVLGLGDGVLLLRRDALEGGAVHGREHGRQLGEVLAVDVDLQRALAPDSVYTSSPDFFTDSTDPKTSTTDRKARSTSS